MSRFDMWMEWLLLALSIFKDMAVLLLVMLVSLLAFSVQLVWWLVRLPVDLLVKCWRVCRG